MSEDEKVEAISIIILSSFQKSGVDKEDTAKTLSRLSYLNLFLSQQLS